MNDQEIMSILPPAPAGVERWIRKKVVQGSYIIYSKKKNEAVCTRCGHKFRADRFDMKHNGSGTCPKCKAEAVYKAEGIGRKNLTEYFRVLLFTHRGKTVYGTLHEIIVDFESFAEPKMWRAPKAIYVFNSQVQEYYRHDYLTGNWGKVKTVKLPCPPRGSFSAESKFERTVVYDKNLEKIFTKTDLKYMWMPEFFIKHNFDAHDLIRYMALGLKYRSVELLIKSGFDNLVEEKLRGWGGYRAVNWRGKSLQKILKLPMGDIRKLPREDLGSRELKAFQMMNGRERNMPWKDIEAIARMIPIEKDRIENTRTVDFMTWVKKTGLKISSWDWCDYVEDCKLLGLDIRKNSVLFPKNFNEVHEKLSRQRKINENEVKDNAIKRIADAFRMDVMNEHLILKIAESQEDLNKESSILSHCVRTYGDRVARGGTLIYFIRVAAEPDMPYYTLEITPDGKFIQCRGKRNCSMTEDVKAFVDEVVKEFNKMIKKKARKAA